MLNKTRFGLLLTACAWILSVGSLAQAEPAPYVMSIQTPSASAGKSATVIVTVTASQGYKANDKYPNKVQSLSVEGGPAELNSTTVPGAASGKSIVYSIPVIPKSTGHYKLTGEVRFSVCTDAACLVEKVPLSAEFDAK